MDVHNRHPSFLYRPHHSICMRAYVIP
jgi:hypothetical protein